MRSLFEAGVDVFRLNASHGTQDDHARRIKKVRELSAEFNTHSGILLDLQGPKIRVGTFKDGPCHLDNDAIFTITTVPTEGTPDVVYTNYSEFARDVKPGDPVLLAERHGAASRDLRPMALPPAAWWWQAAC